LKILAYPQDRLAETGKKQQQNRRRKKKKERRRKGNNIRQKTTKTILKIEGKKERLAETERTIFSQFHFRS